jgi:hypothetical protein
MTRWGGKSLIPSPNGELCIAPGADSSKRAAACWRVSFRILKETQESARSVSHWSGVP